MSAPRVLATLLLVGTTAAVGVLALAARPALPAVGEPVAAADAALIKRGAALATIGDCLACHTAPGGKPFAGGRALATPFGTIYGTNITPDPDTGIGGWSEAAFVRAMREGIDREGHHLYPAFPYDHFTHVSDADLGALYAYLMTRDPVRADVPHNELVFPLNWRPLLAVWKALFFRPGPLATDAAHDARWNRGAYLANGLGHCGACHTPRNRLGAERRDQAFAGGDAEGWHAPALRAPAPAPTPWTADALYTYLKTGMGPAHDVAAGPMAPVAHDLSEVDDEDVRAIATYIASLANGAPGRDQTLAGAAAPRAGHPEGRAVYETACAACHETARDAFFRGALDLRQSTTLHVPTPANLAFIVLAGITPPDGEQGAWMPAFHGSLTDDQVRALIDYLRTDVAGEPAWDDVAQAVRHARAGAGAPATSARGAPAASEQRS